VAGHQTELINTPAGITMILAGDILSFQKICGKIYTFE